MSKPKEFKTSTPKEKEWCAERYGELDLDNPHLHPKIRKRRRAQLISELLDKHELPHTKESRQKIEEAYRTCIPAYNCFSAKYRLFVEKGKSKNFTAENLHLLDSLAIADAQSLHLLKQAIAAAFFNTDFSAVNEKGDITHPNPKLLDIFKIGVTDGYEQTGGANDTSTANIGNKLTNAGRILEELAADEKGSANADGEGA